MVDEGKNFISKNGQEYSTEPSSQRMPGDFSMNARPWNELLGSFDRSRKPAVHKIFCLLLLTATTCEVRHRVER